CGATGVPYSVTPTAGSTYTWTVPEGATVATGQGTSSITVNFGTTNGNVTVTERNAAGCNGTPRILAISLQGCGLDANFEADQLIICIGSSVTFTNTSTGVSPTTTYSWNFGSGAAPASITGIGPHTVTYSTTGAKTVSLTITEGASNIETKTGYITVNPINTINRTSAVGTDNQTVCINTAISNITYSTTGATGATFSGFPSGLTVGWSSNVVTISGTPSTAGTYNYTVTLTGGCGNISTGGTINVSANNTAGTASSTPTVCINTAMAPVTHLTTGATGIGAATGLPAGFSAGWSSNTISISGTPSAAGTFNYTIPLAGGCGTVNATGTITVTANNTVSAASSTPTLCINTALTPITHATTGATGIGAATGLPSGVSAAWGSNIITISGTPAAAGTFNYTIPLTGGCGSVNATGIISVTANNTVSAASSTPALCINTPLTSITHTTSGATGIGSATGLPAGVSAAWASNTITISGTPTASGTFNYIIPLTGGCGTVNATGTITVTPANTITLTSGVGTNNQTVCNGTAITNITYSTTGATGATVTGLPIGVTGNWSAGTVTISGTPSAAGTFGYTVTLAGGCGAITANGTINVNALPATSVITGSATPPCSGVGYVYSVTNTPGSDYAWTVPAGATITAGQGSHSITVTFGTTNGNVAVTERNTAGCYGTPRTLAISLQGCGLSADFSASPRSVCIGSVVSFTNLSTGTTGGTTYSWNFGSGANPLTATGAGPHSVTYGTAGSKDVTLTITEGASDVETKVGYITVNPANTITRTSAVGTDNQTVCVNTAISTITYSTTGATGATFSGLPAGVNAVWSSNVVTISGTPSTAGTFNYTVTLTGGCGNVSASGTITVNVCSKTLSLTSLFLEGLYNGSGTLKQAYDELGPRWPAGIADHIIVELHN
ncbi:MAG: PKD domain-containing protein, partial [Bacteroidales bacterium]|nr:PKD domain-containing protein [Bacteroidales bacterium]